MANDSSLVGGAGKFAFDLDSQKGVTHFLASLRASELTPEQKNEVRDLVFLYTNGDKDQSVKITIEQKVSAYGIKALPVANNPVSQQPVYEYGTSRPAPSFTPASPVMPSTPTPPIPPAQPAAPVPPPVQSAPAPVQTTPRPAVVETPASKAEPIPAAQVPPVASPETITQPQPAPAAAQYDPNQNLARIREIKSLVNEQVGNPVNLIDINNEVGREYMAALLDAMKKLNSGTSVVSAMKRLEEAYQTVEVVIKYNKQKPKPEVPAAQTQEPAPSPKGEPAQKAPSIVDPEEESQTDTNTRWEAPSDSSPEVTDQKPISIPVEYRKTLEPVTQPAPEPEKKIAASPELAAPVNQADNSSTPGNLPVEEAVNLDKDKTLEQRVPVAPAGSPAPIPGTRQRSEAEAESTWGPATDTIRPLEGGESGFDKKPSAGLAEKSTSLADSKDKLKSIHDLPKASSLETSSVSGDPLFTKEVDQGLEHLLSEWSLFKKSGLFGTGPKGREHPLFKKISGLQIPLLLAGRFEGATQEIKQSVTDYMNGWRYEQGIIYEQGETFEHYLRRVIRHILDLQKNKRPS